MLLGKLGLHEQALAIYIMILKDVEKAVNYCDRIYKLGGPDAYKVSFIHIIII